MQRASIQGQSTTMTTDFKPQLQLALALIFACELCTCAIENLSLKVVLNLTPPGGWDTTSDNELALAPNEQRVGTLA